MFFLETIVSEKRRGQIKCLIWGTKDGRKMNRGLTGIRLCIRQLDLQSLPTKSNEMLVGVGKDREFGVMRKQRFLIRRECWCLCQHFFQPFTKSWSYLYRLARRPDFKLVNIYCILRSSADLNGSRWGSVRYNIIRLWTVKSTHTGMFQIFNGCLPPRTNRWTKI
jgi:hypothetical protein